MAAANVGHVEYRPADYVAAYYDNGSTKSRRRSSDRQSSRDHTSTRRHSISTQPTPMPVYAPPVLQPQPQGAPVLAYYQPQPYQVMPVLAHAQTVPDRRSPEQAMDPVARTTSLPVGPPMQHGGFYTLGPNAYPQAQVPLNPYAQQPGPQFNVPTVEPRQVYPLGEPLPEERYVIRPVDDDRRSRPSRRSKRSHSESRASRHSRHSHRSHKADKPSHGWFDHSDSDSTGDEGEYDYQKEALKHRMWKKVDKEVSAAYHDLESRYKDPRPTMTDSLVNFGGVLKRFALGERDGRD